MKKGSISVPMVIGVLGLALISFFLVSQVSGIQIDSVERRLYDNKYSNGYYGLKILLKKLGLKVETNISKNFTPVDNSVVVYTDYSEDDTLLNPDIVLWVEKGNTLIIDAELYDFIFDSDITVTGEEEPVTFTPTELEDITTITTDMYIDETKLEIGDIDIIAESESGIYILETYIGSGSIILITDFRVFNNRLFKEGNIQKAYILDYLFRQAEPSRVYLREKVRTFKQNPSFLRDMYLGAYSHITIQVSVLLLLLVLYYGKRFIKSSNVVPKRQRRVTEHIDAVANLYKKAGATDLVTRIDVDFFTSVICKNKIPLGIDEETYHNSITENDFKTGFILRQGLISKIKARK